MHDDPARYDVVIDSGREEGRDRAREGVNVCAMIAVYLVLRGTMVV